MDNFSYIQNLGKTDMKIVPLGNVSKDKWNFKVIQEANRESKHNQHTL